MLGGIPLYVALLVVPGLDAVRYRWSAVPRAVEFIAFAAVAASLVTLFLVMRENTFLSRIVEIQKDRGHTVVSTGPYAIVRHPMYLGMGLLYVMSPLALGSYWAMIPAVLIVPILIARILNEEKVLIRDLPGYAEYRQKVKYRLLPNLW